jgi:hypothetical protein
LNEGDNFGEPNADESIILKSISMFMSIWWDYISELRPPTGLLSISQMIYEYGEPRWNDIDRVKPNDSKTSAILSITNPYELTRARTRASVERRRRLTAWATTRPKCILKIKDMRVWLRIWYTCDHGNKYFDSAEGV